MNSTVFGIHVGNSGACLAVCKIQPSDYDIVENLEIVANNAGERVTPAIVTVTETEDVVGTACKSLMISRWNTTVFNNKRLLDEDAATYTPEPVNGHRRVAVVIENDELVYEIPLEDRTEHRTPMAIARCIYHNLRGIAESAMPGAEGDIPCVLLVPNDMPDEVRFHLRTTVEEVGWRVLQIITEPAAAVLGYNILQAVPTTHSRKVLVYRVGGKSCDVTVFDLFHHMIEYQGSEYTEEVGGNVIIKSLTTYLAQEFYRKYKLDPKESHRSLTKLTLAAENCLHVLSTIESANCFVESLCEGVDFSYQMSRARFESLLNPHLADFAKPVHKVLDRLNMAPNEIEWVLLCGGPMKIPKLRSHISNIFDDEFTKIVPLPKGVNYDEVLAMGAAREAGDITLLNTSAFLPDQTDIHTLGARLTVTVTGGVCSEVDLPEGTPLPVERTMRVTSPEETVTLLFTQHRPEQMNLKGQVELEDIPDGCELSLEVNWEVGIRVNVPRGEGDHHAHNVRLGLIL